MDKLKQSMKLDPPTKTIINLIEAQGFRVEIHRVKGRTRIAAIAPDGDEEWGIAATPYLAAVELLRYVQARESMNES